MVKEFFKGVGKVIGAVALAATLSACSVFNYVQPTILTYGQVKKKEELEKIVTGSLGKQGRGVVGFSVEDSLDSFVGGFAYSPLEVAHIDRVEGEHDGVMYKDGIRFIDKSVLREDDKDALEKVVHVTAHKIFSELPPEEIQAFEEVFNSTYHNGSAAFKGIIEPRMNTQIVKEKIDPEYKEFMVEEHFVLTLVASKLYGHDPPEGLKQFMDRFSFFDFDFGHLREKVKDPVILQRATDLVREIRYGDEDFLIKAYQTVAIQEFFMLSQRVPGRNKKGEIESEERMFAIQSQNSTPPLELVKRRLGFRIDEYFTRAVDALLGFEKDQMILLRFDETEDGVERKTRDWVRFVSDVNDSYVKKRWQDPFVNVRDILRVYDWMGIDRIESDVGDRLAERLGAHDDFLVQARENDDIELFKRVLIDRIQSTILFNELYDETATYDDIFKDVNRKIEQEIAFPFYAELNPNGSFYHERGIILTIDGEKRAKNPAASIVKVIEDYEFPDHIVEAALDDVVTMGPQYQGEATILAQMLYERGIIDEDEAARYNNIEENFERLTKKPMQEFLNEPENPYTVLSEMNIGYAKVTIYKHDDFECDHMVIRFQNGDHLEYNGEWRVLAGKDARGVVTTTGFKTGINLKGVVGRIGRNDFQKTKFYFVHPASGSGAQPAQREYKKLQGFFHPLMLGEKESVFSNLKLDGWHTKLVDRK